MKGGGGKKKYIKKYTKPVIEGGTLYGGGGSTTDSCKTILFKTRLQKTTSAVTALLPGDELSITNNRGDLQARNSSGNVCGSIVSTQNSRIIECMGKGYIYKAVVNSVSGSNCEVTVQIA